jgi:protease IV
MTEENWEKDVLEKIATEGIQEQKRSRRWGIFFKLLTFVYLFVVLIMLIPSKDDGLGKSGEKHTAVVNLKGVIAPNTEASADKVITGLRNAFKNKSTAGVVLRINSPGGSPVQSGYIYDEMLRLREKYPEVPLHAVISDIGASGGYYVAAAAENIYVNQSSIVGSIGVRMDNFGVVEAMKKLGIERRTLTAGENKALLDPFSPTNPEVTKHLKTLLNNIHDQFINAVKVGRGDRLKEVEGMFSGLIWTGDQSVEIGLADQEASTSYVAREIIGAENIVDFTMQPDFFERFSESVGAKIAHILTHESLLPQLKP